MLAFQRKQVSTFLKAMNKASLVSPAFSSNLDEENIKEGWEKLVLSQIYNEVFLAGVDEPKANSSLSKKIESFHWIQERHLDIPLSFSLALEVASAELLRVNGFKAPRDKFIVMQNVLKLIIGILSSLRYYQAVFWR